MSFGGADSERVQNTIDKLFLAQGRKMGRSRPAGPAVVLCGGSCSWGEGELGEHESDLITHCSQLTVAGKSTHGAFAMVVLMRRTVPERG